MNLRPVFVTLTVAIMLAASACAPGRYLSTVRHHAPMVPANYDGDTAELDALLEETRVEAEKHGLLNGIDERILLVMDQKAAWSVEIKDGKAKVQKGLAPGFVPTLTAPISPQQVKNIRAIVDDGKIDENEKFNLAYGLYAACLKRIHDMFYFRGDGDKSILGVDDYMQFRLKNTEGFTYHGVTVDVAVTVINTDGYFFYLPGHVGEPDARYEFTMEQGLELYRLTVYEAEKNKDNPAALRDIGLKTRDLLLSAKTFERDWH